MEIFTDDLQNRPKNAQMTHTYQDCLGLKKIYAPDCLSKNSLKFCNIPINRRNNKSALAYQTSPNQANRQQDLTTWIPLRQTVCHCTS